MKSVKAFQLGVLPLSGKTFPFWILESKCRPAHTEGGGCTSAQTEININPERCSCRRCVIRLICNCSVLRRAWKSLCPSPSSRSHNKTTFQQKPTRTEFVLEHAPVLQSGTSQAPKQLLMTFFFPLPSFFREGKKNYPWALKFVTR